MFDEHAFDERQTMGMYDIADRWAPQAPRTLGALALAESPARAARPAPARVAGAERTPDEARVRGETPAGSVRVLPVAVPARRRPIHPTRGALSRARAAGVGAVGVGAVGAGSVRHRPAELWADVTAWGADAGTRAPAPGAGGSRAAAPSTGGLRARASTSVPSMPAAGPWRRRPAPRALPAVSARQARAVVLGLALAAAVGVGVLLAFLAPAPLSAAAQAPAPSETVAVSAGESLWSIAAAHTEPGTDVRDTMESIASANALVDGQVRTGQVLVVPADR